MKRPAGVTAVAVVSILGGCLACIFGLFAILGALMMRHAPEMPGQTAPPPQVLSTILVFEVVFYLGLGVFAIVSAIGLLRLKNWARIATIVLGCFLAVFGLLGLFGAAIMTSLPIPAPSGEELRRGIMTGVAIGIGAVCLALVGVGIWWVVFLNRRGVRAPFTGELAVAPVPDATGQFAPAAPPAAPSIPISIALIAWYMIVSGALSFPFLLLSQYPAVILGMVLHGWRGKLFHSAYLVAHLGIGIGLLRVKPFSRPLAIWFYLFSLANLSAYYLSPAARAWMKGIAEQTLRNDPNIFGPNFMRFMWFVLAFSALLVVVILYFLITGKEAYLAAAEQHALASSP